MKLGTRSRIAIAATVLATGALLGPAAEAGTTLPYPPPQCMEDHCDMLIQYYSDATYTVRVGEYGSEVCGYIEWGQVTEFRKGFRRYC